MSAGGRLFNILDEGMFLFDKGGATGQFRLIARNAFNGVLFFKKTLEGYGQPFYEDVSGQAVNDFIWRTPRSMNRRLVAVDEKVFAALKYRQRVIQGVIFRDGVSPRNCLTLSEGSTAEVPEIGDMLKRGHHVRCFPGKPTERFLITPMRGAEFIDLSGAGEHMVNDWLRGACSLGQMPANGLLYVTPDPCSCYAGAHLWIPRPRAQGARRPGHRPATR